jgi:hypothetical protein
MQQTLKTEFRRCSRYQAAALLLIAVIIVIRAVVLIVAVLTLQRLHLRMLKK